MPEGKRNNDAKPYHHGNLRDALIIAAAELIEESGTEDFAMVDAARRAGVSSAAPYRHFKDKDDLLMAVGELGFFDLSNRMDEIQASHEAGSLECIIALGKGYIRFVTARPAFFDIMWGERGFNMLEDIEEEHSQLRVSGFWVLVNQIRNWCEKEGLAKTDALDLALKLWSMAMGLSHLSINHHLERFAPDVDPYELLDSSTRSFLRGVREGPSC